MSKAESGSRTELAQMPDRCKILFCDRPVKARGLCNTCYQRERANGRLKVRRQATRCDEEGCRQPYYSLGKCRLHYQRLRRNGTTESVRRAFQNRPGCDIPGCKRPHGALGLCKPHWHQRRKIEQETTAKGKPSPLLPAEPLHAAIREMKIRGSTDGEIAERLGIDRRQLYGDRDKPGLMDKTEIRRATADRYATALEIHPASIWPDEWDAPNWGAA